jgi:hypothetical protein
MRDPYLKRILLLGTYALAMLLITLGLGRSLIWVSPDWIEPLAFWQGEIVQDQKARFEVNAPASYTVASTEEATPSLLESMAITVSFEPRLGALAEHPMGASLSMPSDALPSATTIRLEPVWPGQAPNFPTNASPLGFGFRILFDGQLSKTLSRDATLQIKISDSIATSYPMRIVHQDPTGWKVPTTLVQNQTLSIRVNRGGVFFPVAWGQPSKPDTARKLLADYLRSGGLVNDARLNRIYDTQHFEIFFADRGVHAVPNNASFPLRPKTSPERVNAFVTLVGETLEEVYLKLDSIGLARREPRINVFLTSAYGDALTPLGGPIWISVDTDLYNPDKATEQLRGTITESLLRALLGQGTPWFDQMRAMFLTDYFWTEQGSPINHLKHVMQRYPKEAAHLLKTPISQGSPIHNRLYAAFFHWLNQRGDVPDLLGRLQLNKSLTAAQLNQILQQRGQPSLGDLLSLFARNYYHDRYWETEGIDAHLFAGDFTQQALLQSAVPSSFTIAMHQPDNVYRNLEGLKLTPLVNLLLPLVDETDHSHTATLVLLAEFRGDPPVIAFASEQIQQALPQAGVPNRFAELDETSSRLIWTHPIEGGETQANYFSFIFSNISDAQSQEISRLARWLLHAPSWGVEKQGASQTQLYWQDMNQPHLASIFAGYNLYQLEGDSAFEDATLLEEGIMQSQHELQSSASDLRYAVTLADVYGKESPPVFLTKEDPFVGTWQGRIRYRGDRAELETIQRLLSYFHLDENNSSWIPDQNFLWKFGIPVGFQIHRDQTGYRVSITQFGFQNRVPRSTDPVLKRHSPFGLFQARADEIPQRKWTLTRNNEIEGSVETATGTFEWQLWRSSKEESAK